MDEWQSRALQIFPELQVEIKRTQGGIHGLWADIFFSLVEAYRATPVNDDFIRRVYEYAAWCVHEPQTDDAETDLSSATAVGFWENLPLDQQVSDDLHRWLSVETFEGSKTLFLYHLSDEVAQRFHSKKEGRHAAVGPVGGTQEHFRLPVPAQPVDATPSNALFHRAFPIEPIS